MRWVLRSAWSFLTYSMPFRRCAAWCGAISIRNSTPNDVAFVCSARRPPACNSRRMRSVVSSIRDRRLTDGCACTPMAVSKPLCGEWRERCDTLAARAVGRTTEVDAMKYAICAMMLTLGITAAPAQAELDMKEGYWETVVTISVGGGIFAVERFMGEMNMQVSERASIRRVDLIYILRGERLRACDAQAR